MIKRLMLRPELVAVVLAVAVVLLAAQNLLRSDVAIAATGDIAKEDRTAAGGWTTQTLVATDGWVLTADASAAVRSSFAMSPVAATATSDRSRL